MEPQVAELSGVRQETEEDTVDPQDTADTGDTGEASARKEEKETLTNIPEPTTKIPKPPTEDKKKKPPPISPPRRSERERKPPARFDMYHMNQMVHRPYMYDTKLQALETLMSSGLLTQFDTEMAHKMVKSMME